MSGVSEFLRSYLTVAWFGLAAVLLAGLLLWVSSLVRPSRPGREKLLTYESGVDPVGEGWSQSQVRYYIFALLFVVFDVEAVFIFPWATQLERYGTFGLVEMGVFVVRRVVVQLHSLGDIVHAPEKAGGEHQQP